MVRSVGGAGRARVDPRVASPPPTLGGQTSGRSPTPTPASSARLTPQQRYDRYVQDVERYQNNPAHTRLPQLIAQHEQKVKQYGIDPQLRQYEQKLSAYNAQLEAHERAIARGQGLQETANRLQLMRQELEGTRTSIESRKRQELAEIQMLEANIRKMAAPLQAVSAAKLGSRPHPSALKGAAALGSRFFKPSSTGGRRQASDGRVCRPGTVVTLLPYLGPRTVVPRPGPSGLGAGENPLPVAPENPGEWGHDCAPHRWRHPPQAELAG